MYSTLPFIDNHKWFSIAVVHYPWSYKPKEYTKVNRIIRVRNSKKKHVKKCSLYLKYVPRLKFQITFLTKSISIIIYVFEILLKVTFGFRFLFIFLYVQNHVPILGPAAAIIIKVPRKHPFLKSNHIYCMNRHRWAHVRTLWNCAAIFLNCVHNK